MKNKSSSLLRKILFWLSIIYAIIYISVTQNRQRIGNLFSLNQQNWIFWEIGFNLIFFISVLFILRIDKYVNKKRFFNIPNILLILFFSYFFLIRITNLSHDISSGTERIEGMCAVIYSKYQGFRHITNFNLRITDRKTGAPQIFPLNSNQFNDLKGNLQQNYSFRYKQSDEYSCKKSSIEILYAPHLKIVLEYKMLE